jgi:hypothetical protein
MMTAKASNKAMPEEVISSMSKMRPRGSSMSAESLELWKSGFEIAGVALLLFTFIAGAGVVWFSRKLNIIQAQQLREFDKDLTGAKIELGKQQVIAADAVGRVAGLEHDAADAKAAQQRVELDLEKQKERTANAEKELLALQEHNKPRHLIPEKREKVVAALKAFPAQKVNLFAYNGDNEIVGISNEIMDLLGPKGAGWHVSASSGTEMTRAIGGILVEVKGAAPPAIQPAAENLVLALKDEHLTTFGPSPLGNTNTLGVGPSDPTAPIRITIGKKL